MAKQRRKFKQRIISEVESGLIPVNAANRKYQISGSVIDRCETKPVREVLTERLRLGERFGTRESRAEGNSPSCILRTAT